MSKLNVSPNAITTNRKIPTVSTFKKNKTLLLMCLPAILFFLIFSYLPMPGVYVAFVKFNYAKGIFGSPFAGFENFKFLINSGDLFLLTKNTILYNLAFIIFGNTLQIFFAILLNEISSKWFKKLSQTVMFLPYFISAVVIGVFAYNMLSYEHGLINNVLNTLGMEPIKVYSSTTPWPFIIVLTYLWQSTGYGTIVYFASIMGIDMEIIEASEIDGANALQRIRHITLPCLKPTFIILFLYALGGILRGNFGLIYNLVGSTNSTLFATTDIIETFVFRSLMNNFNFSLGSAVGLYQSVFGLIIILSANWLVRKIEPDYSLF